MKKIISGSVGIIVIIILVVCLVYYFNRFSFSADLYRKNFFTEEKRKSNDTILRVGLIGDSWVAFGRLDTIINHRLKEYNIENRIFFAGQGGNVTKEIYENIYKPEGMSYSFKKVIDAHPKYCVVISGVNDSNKQMGKEYYSHHLLLIMETLIKEKIKPVIVAIPAYGIQENFNNFSYLKKLRFKSFALINNNGNINNFRDYNEFFHQRLKEVSYKDSVIYINNMDKFDYTNERQLFKDILHLNLKGNQSLGKIIADSIINRENKVK